MNDARRGLAGRGGGKARLGVAGRGEVLKDSFAHGGARLGRAGPG